MVPVWWLVETEGFGGVEDSDDEGNDEPELPLSHARQSEDRSTAINIKDDTETTDEADDEFATEDEGLLNPHRLSHSVGRSSTDQPRVPRRMSSPFGMKDSVGPGGGSRLSNGLGQSNSGFGTGGNSYS